MKRTCNGCKALDTTFQAQCKLGYNIEIAKEYDHISVSWKPLEECDKPMTTSDFIYAYGIRMKQRKSDLDKHN
jgi:hypothetical protein